MQIKEPAKVHPVIVIGSGAAGGMAAWNLTRKGIDVLMLDAGESFDRAKFWTHAKPWEDRARRQKGERPPSFFLDAKEQPYLTPEGRPFELTRVWGLGGKTNVWGRVSLRYSEMDFKSAERDGWEIPWPISYADVAPYYDQVEEMIGVCGGDDDSEVLPGSRSTRLLLNSRSDRHPNGIGNGSDVVGRYLCEQVRINVGGWLPALYGGPTLNDRGIGGEHVYLPRFNHREGHRRDYLRGFGMQFWNSGNNPNGPAQGAYGLPGFGPSLKQEVKRRHPAWVELHPFGEVLPYAHNRITVDATQIDRYGVPLARIDYRIGDNERKMVDHMADTVEAIVKAAGGELVNYRRGQTDRMGSAIHEHGTVRMGADPKRSALNGWNQMHEVKNVFVTDGSAFTTASEKNPTLTILALSWRATDYLAEEIRKGNL